MLASPDFLDPTIQFNLGYAFLYFVCHFWFKFNAVSSVGIVSLLRLGFWFSSVGIVPLLRPGCWFKFNAVSSVGIVPLLRPGRSTD